MFCKFYVVENIIFCLLFVVLRGKWDMNFVICRYLVEGFLGYEYKRERCSYKGKVV